MSDPIPSKRRWIGRTIIGISIIHTVFAFAAFGAFFKDMLGDGLYNSVGEDPMRAATAWFFFAGIFMASTGIAVDLLEKHGFGNALKPLGFFLLVVTALGILMMPVSGFWLFLVPVAGMVRSGKS